MDKNISFGYTLEKYNKRYGKHRDKLLKYSKKDIEEFDKKYGHYEFNGKTHSLEYKNYLLRNRKWALIEDTYYEIPTFKTYFLAWWILLPAAGHIAFASVTTAAVASAVVFPTLAATGVFHKDGNVPSGPLEWYEDSSYINSLGTSDIGMTKVISVNGLDHTIRLIGIDHDDLTTGNGKAHTTWEFVNLISDSNGNSICYQWNDTNNKSSANFDYINSTLRYALTGSGNNGGKNNNTVLAAVKEGTNWNNDYKNKTVISMLPKKLAKAIKSVKKQVGKGSTYAETTYNDTLFPLSCAEMGISPGTDRGYGKKYEYYDLPSATRIKKQINNEVVCKYEYDITIPQSSGQAYNGAVYNTAGANFKLDDTQGGLYFLRSPDSSMADYAWHIHYNGNPFLNAASYGNAYAIAPAFCL